MQSVRPSVCVHRTSSFIVVTLFLISGFFRERRGNLTGKINRRRERYCEREGLRRRWREFNLKSFLPLVRFRPFLGAIRVCAHLAMRKNAFLGAQGPLQGWQKWYLLDHISQCSFPYVEVQHKFSTFINPDQQLFCSEDIVIQRASPSSLWFGVRRGTPLPLLFLYFISDSSERPMRNG